MKAAAVDVYVCPSCMSSLRLHAEQWRGDEILDGALRCPGCGASYPIVRAVPRFVPVEAYASSFGRQWKWFRRVQLDSMSQCDRSARDFDGTTGWLAADLTGRRVLDAGVGAGRYAEVAADRGAEVFGIDLTTAIDVAHANLGWREHIHLAQADVFAPPFRPGTFDKAYSIGVLHHTPDPEAAFGRVAGTVRQGGEFAVYLYARYGSWFHMSDLARHVTTRLPARVMLAASAAAIPLYYPYRLPVVGKLLQRLMPISLEADWRWRWLDTFDWYTPTYQWKLEYPEVHRWYRANGFEWTDVFDGPIRVCGRKMAAPGGEAGREVHLDRVVAS